MLKKSTRAASVKFAALVLAIALTQDLFGIELVTSKASAQNNTSAVALRSLTSNVLRNLGKEPAPDIQIQQNARISTLEGETDYRALTFKALANLNASPQNEASAAELKKLISAAIIDGKPEAYIDDLLSKYVDALLYENESKEFADGPDTTQTTPNKIAAIISKSQSDKPAPKVIRPVARTNKQRSHIVQPGEHLGNIAFKYFGRTSAYHLIYQANKSKMDSPDDIRIGQKLIIPAG